MPHRFSFSEGDWRGRRRVFRTDRIIAKVRVSPNASDEDIGNAAKAVLNHIGGRLVRRRPGDTLFVGEVQGGDIPAIAEHLMDPTTRLNVEFAEPDLRVRSCGTMTPTDYYYNNSTDDVNKQWGPERINAEVAWGLVPSAAEDLLIAVVDSGLSMNGGAFDHPELKASRFLSGKAYTGTDLRDEHYHGTHMAGIIAAPADNSISGADVVDGTTTKEFGTGAEGVAGMNWTSPVVIHRVLDAGKHLDEAAGAGGGIADVYDAVMEVKARVIDSADPITRAVVNLSLGVTEDDGEATTASGSPKTMEHMCGEIAGLPIILCCATGNASGGESADAGVEYPAAYAGHGDFAGNVIAVGSTDRNGDDDVMAGDSKYDADADRVTVVAPGVAITSTLPTAPTEATGEYMYGHYSGTSEATAHVTGTASLIWSRNDKLSASQVIEILRNTAVPLESGSVPNRQWGYGRIDAGAAVSAAETEVRADETSITLANVEMGTTDEHEIVLLIRSSASIKFTVTVSGYDFGVTPGTTTYTPTADSPPEDYVRFQVGVASYTGNNNDPIAYGTVSILQEGEADPIVIYITASTVGASTALISLALDRSGSMDEPSGVGALTRMEVLKRATSIMVEALRVNDAMGLVSFSADAAELASVTTVTVEDDDPGKADLITKVGTLAADGLTAIGDGLEAADDQITAEIDSGASYTHQAIVVLTDGKETTGKYIDEVSVSYPVYAVAMGVETEVDTVKLERLVGHSAGYLLMSGELDDFGVYRIAKYFLQILVNVSVEEIVTDPQERILPEQEHVVPFDITTSDTRCDVFLLMPGMPDDARGELRGILDLRLITPDGRIVDPGVADGDRTVYRHGAFVSYYRLQLPFTMHDHDEHTGRWRALVTVDGQRFKQYVAWRNENGADTRALQVHGVPCMLLVHARSSVRFDAVVEQRGFNPGAPVTMRARVTESGRPLAGLATVKVHLEYPDGSKTEFKVREVDPGIYEETRTATIAGTYSWRITAEGRTRDGQWFTRERVATASVWV